MSEGPVEFLVDLQGREPDESLELLIEHAAGMQASDVSFASEEDGVQVTVRHLGTIRPVACMDLDFGRRVVTRLKVLAAMDIAERRRPQEGRWMYASPNMEKVDLRVSALPTLYGEDLNVRLMVRQAQRLPLEKLGMTRQEYNLVLAMLSRPSGLILVTGPTGSGKTTTLYACIQFLNDGSRKINTIEDPVEYALKGVRQSQVNVKNGVDFPDLLRSVLRQGPDVIMVGEIRDHVTAQTAVRAANSGHLVFATLHAPVAANAVQSMLALGAHPHFLSSALRGVIAQRLIRTLDPETRVPFDLSEAPHAFDDVRAWLEEGEGGVIYGPGTPTGRSPDGYAGRTGVFEVLPISPQIRRLILDARPPREIEQQAVSEGMLEFRRGALLRVAQGITSTEEIVRSVPAEYLGGE